MRYEYDIALLTSRRDVFLEALNERGAERWQLVAVVHTDQPGYTRCIFVREVVDLQLGDADANLSKSPEGS